MKILENGIAVIEEDSHISKWVKDTGRLDHDQSLLPVLGQHIKPGDWVLDGGAFIGDHTIFYLNQVRSEGMVLAVEANPEAYQCLVYNCPSAICINAALSDRVGKMGIATGNNKGATHGIVGDLIMTIPLDSLSLPRLNFIKLDIEGMEVQAIKGAVNLIRRHKPIICVEVNQGALLRQGYSSDTLIDLIIGLGYRSKKVYESDNYNSPQFDLLFLPL